MNKKYEVLPHPAELRLRIYGKTLEELFSNAALALARILKSNIKDFASPRDLRSPDIKKIKIKIQSVDINTLLVDFLNEILAKSQINKRVYIVADINIETSDVPNINKNLRTSEVLKLTAELAGYPVDHFDEDIKAVTYQDLNIQEIKGIWQTILVFDI